MGDKLLAAPAHSPHLHSTLSASTSAVMALNSYSSGARARTPHDIVAPPGAHVRALVVCR